jgi:hypothetical protein
MTDPASQQRADAKFSRTCPECGAVVQGNVCWLCHRALTDNQARQPDFAAAQIEHDQRSQQTFGLSTLFLFITVIAVCLGVFVAAPGLGILLAVIAVPAFIRTSVAASVEELAAGQPVNVAQKMSLFLGSLGIVLLIGLAGFGAFFAACWTSCAALAVTGALRGGLFDSGLGLLLINLFAGGIALAIVVWLIRKTWPRHTRRR